MFDEESPFNVLVAFIGSLLTLLVSVAKSNQSVIVDGTGEVLRDTATEQFALVKSSLQASAPVQWYRHQKVDIVESPRG